MEIADSICSVYVIPGVTFCGITPKTCCRVINHTLENTKFMDCPSKWLPTSTFDLYHISEGRKGGGNECDIGKA